MFGNFFYFNLLFLQSYLEECKVIIGISPDKSFVKR